jgi:hypothetical protein
MTEMPMTPQRIVAALERQRAGVTG